MATFIILNIIHKWNISSSYPCPETVMSLYLIQNLINSHVFISIHVANISGSHTSYYIRWFYPIRWQWSTSMDHTHTYITSDGFILNIGNDIHQWITHIYMHTHQMVLSYTLAMICIYGSHTHIISDSFILHVGNDMHQWITHTYHIIWFYLTHWQWSASMDHTHHIRWFYSTHWQWSASMDHTHTSDGLILHLVNDLHQWLSPSHRIRWFYPTWWHWCV